jgi:ribosomal protein S18 acetylase RimI-like enzyme
MTAARDKRPLRETNDELPVTHYHLPITVFSIRPALSLDIDALSAIDQLAQTDAHRREFITRSVANGFCSVIVDAGGGASGGIVAGYGVLDYAFFENGFISMLYVDAAHRRQGAGLLLLGHLEGLCQTPKLFTSTNLSNQPMQALLAKADYRLSGVVHDLDEGDPELVYVKYLSR